MGEILLYDPKIKHGKLKVALAIVLSFFALAFCVFCFYVGIYYHASDGANRIAKEDTEDYIVRRSGSDLYFIPENAFAGLVFYPGGKVEYTAYAPLMAEFAKQNVACVLIDMPFNLAVFGKNAATSARGRLSGIKRWYVGGHSLGGAMAASYISDHAEEYEGLVLLGAYSTSDISNTSLNVISVYGSEDGVLNKSKYDSCKPNLPQDYCEQVIQGGCHAYFGDYGAQSGDGTPTISREQQISLTVDFVIRSMNR